MFAPDADVPLADDCALADAAEAEAVALLDMRAASDEACTRERIATTSQT